MLHDLRFARRSLWKAPAFTVTVVLTLALGIGVTAVVFGVVDAALLRPLPYAHADRLVMVWEKRNVDVSRYSNPERMRNMKWQLSDRELPRYREGNHTFTTLAGYMPWTVTLTGSGEPARLRALLATPELFGILGVRPALGRAFGPEEDRYGNNGVVLLSHRFWQQRFGGDPRVLGTKLTIDGEPHVVIGVMPAGVRVQLPATGGDPLDVWMPASHQMSLTLNTNRARLAIYMTVGALRPGLTMAQAQADLEAIGRQMEQQRKRNFTGIWLMPVLEAVAGDVRPALLILLAAVACVLLVGCANIANLMLARNGARRSEMAVRAALGAGRAQLARYTIAECLWLGALGGAAGLIAARIAGGALRMWIPTGTIPRLEDAGFGWRVLLFTAALSIVVALLFGIPAAFGGAPAGLYDALKQAAPGSGGSRRGSLLRRGMVVAEIALAVTLVIGAGLLVRSFLRLRGVDLGFRTERIATLAVELPEFRYPKAPQRTEFAKRVLERLRGADGVEVAAVTNYVPIARGPIAGGGLDIEGGPRDLAALYRAVTPDYFRAMGIRLKRGRPFTDRDSDAAVIVNETLARRGWPGVADVVGKRVKAGDRWAEVVGVVSDIKHDSAGMETGTELYVPFSQNLFGSVDFVVRMRPGARDPAPLLRGAVKAVDASFPIGEALTMDQIVSDSVATPRFYMRLLSLFAALAAALAAVGIYGLIAYSVVRRTHEIGVRVAIGATRGAIFRMMLREGVLLGAAGVAVGALAAFGATRLMASLLFGVKPADPLTFAAVGAAFVTVAAAASGIPAARTSRIDPVTTLRQQ